MGTAGGVTCWRCFNYPFAALLSSFVVAPQRVPQRRWHAFSEGADPLSHLCPHLLASQGQVLDGLKQALLSGVTVAMKIYFYVMAQALA